jgi:hypothetical protein
MRSIIATAVVFSSLILPAAAFAGTNSDDVAATTATVRVSTGVIGPTLLNSMTLSLPAGLTTAALPLDSQVEVSFVVNEKGEPEQIQVTKGINPQLDAMVVDSVGKLHYRPGTIDNQKVQVGVNLTVHITR